ncbi:glycoside hydrolase superfamily [Podospora fimiseda]|uniref:Alpha-galactosidase n=1 Tax=Podospora fimiseda TaxID=252190 RepID=A0AAN6YN08_9PEZI|nr:glycoside hydrolase superfamily [Podospora fimiseda]
MAKWHQPVVDQIHGMGLKFGLYGCAGVQTCAGYPGSEGHEKSDVAQLVSWGVDFWKYDNCYTPCRKSPRPQTCQNPSGNTSTFYAQMRDAIVAANSKETKKMHFNLCHWGRDQVWIWGANYGHSWRMSVDNWGDWASIERIGSAAAGIYKHSAPVGFNDLDMLYLGSSKINENQSKLHFGLWAITKSPLVLGMDLNKISSSNLAIIKNKGIIDINQDPLGKAATNLRPPGAAVPTEGKIYPYWAQ